MTPHIGSETLWDRLRKRREELGLSIEEVAQTTRIPVAKLKAIESGDPNRLPAPIYIKGFIRAYARQLKLDSDDLIQEYVSHYEPEPEELILAVSTAPTRSSFLLPVLVIGLLLLAILAGGGYYVYHRMIEPGRMTPAKAPAPIAQNESQPAPTDDQQEGQAAGPETEKPQTEETATAPAAQETPAQAPTAAAETRADEPTGQTAAKTASEQPLAAHTLKAVARAKTWLRVDIDGGETIRQYMLEPGDTVSWTAERTFALRLGNAGGVVLFLDGKELPPLGASGEVRDVTVPAAGQTSEP